MPGGLSPPSFSGASRCGREEQAFGGPLPASLGGEDARLFSCFDVRIASEIDLGELTPAADAADTRAIVRVRYGDVPNALDGATPPVAGLQAIGDTALLSIGKTARYLIRSGREIIVQPLPAASERNVRLFLLGSALGVLAYQRGLFPLHANAVVIDGVAHAFTGHSGAGKSTLAAYFARAGHRVLCDDVCVVSLDADRRPLAWPGLPRVKLWQDAADALGQATQGLDRAIEGRDKYHVPMRADAGGPVPLAAIYRLSRAADGDAGIVPVRGIEAMMAIAENSYRGGYVRALGLARQHFEHAAAICRHARVFAAQRAWGFDVFDREAERLLAHARALAA